MNFENSRLGKFERVEHKIKKFQEYLAKNYPNKKRWKKHMKLYSKFENERQNQQSQIYQNEIIQKEIESVNRELNELDVMIKLEKANGDAIRSEISFLDDRISEMGGINSKLVETLLSSRRLNYEVDRHFLDIQLYPDRIYSHDALKLNIDSVEESTEELDLSSKENTANSSSDEEKEVNDDE